MIRLEAKRIICLIDPTGDIRCSKPTESSLECWDGNTRAIGPPVINAKPVIETATLRIHASEAINLLARMKTCSHWIAISHCGCGVNTCQKGKGKLGLVNHHDCFKCLREGDPFTVVNRL